MGGGCGVEAELGLDGGSENSTPIGRLQDPLLSWTSRGTSQSPIAGNSKYLVRPNQIANVTGSGNLIWETIPGGNVAPFETRINTTSRMEAFGTNFWFVTRDSSTNVLRYQLRYEPDELGGPVWNPSWTTVAPNQIVGEPSVSSFYNSAITDGGTTVVDIFVMGTDSQVYMNGIRPNGTSTGYVPLGGTPGANASPVAASKVYAGLTNSERDVFLRSTSGTLTSRYFKGGVWSGWYTVAPNQILGNPVAISSDSGYWVYVMGTDGAIYRIDMTIQNPNTAGSTRQFTWSGYKPCGKPNGVSLNTARLAVAYGFVFVADISSGNTLWQGSGSCL